MDQAEFSPNDVVRWIHAVEYNKPVRMAGLITELYFAKQLERAKLKEKYSSIAQGWLYTTHCSASDTIRHWCRITDENRNLSAVEQMFFDRLHPIGHKFFSIHWQIQLKKQGGAERPEISIEVDEWISKQVSTKTDASFDKAMQINELLRVYLSGVSFIATHRWGKSLPFAEWFESIDLQALTQMFVIRCVMNALEKQAPIDLDAMALTCGSEELVFIEFKRKYPTKGRSQPTRSQYHPADYSAFAEGVMQAIKASNAKTPMSKFNASCAARGFEYVRQPSFGLDMHHFETIMLCEKAGVKYRYVIWNAGSSVDKEPRTLGYTLKALRALLTPAITPVETPVWWVPCLTPSDVAGLTFTSGEDSGSYSDEIRLQVTFDVSSHM